MSTELATIDKTLEDCAYKIELAQTSTVWNVIEIGKALHEAREAIRADGSRCFASWAKERVGISKSGAYRAIAVYERFGNRPTLGRLEVSEAYMLAMDGVPDEAIDQAIEESERQEAPLGRQRIEEIKDEHRVPVVHDEHGGTNDGQHASKGSTNHAPARVSGLAAESAGGDGFAVDCGPGGGCEGSESEQDGSLDGEHRETVHAERTFQDETDHWRHKGNATKAESNIISDASRQIIAEAEFATENLADYQVLAIYERVRVWFAQDLERRGIKP